MTDDYADVAAAVREDERPPTLRDLIIAEAWRRYPHARSIEISPLGRLRIELPAVIDAVCVSVTV